MRESDTKQPEPGRNVRVIVSSYRLSCGQRYWRRPTACARMPVLLQRCCLLQPVTRRNISLLIVHQVGTQVSECVWGFSTV